MPITLGTALLAARFLCGEPRLPHASGGRLIPMAHSLGRDHSYGMGKSKPELASLMGRRCASLPRCAWVITRTRSVPRAPAITVRTWKVPAASTGSKAERSGNSYRSEIQVGEISSCDDELIDRRKDLPGSCTRERRRGGTDVRRPYRLLPPRLGRLSTDIAWLLGNPVDSFGIARVIQDVANNRGYARQVRARDSQRE